MKDVAATAGVSLMTVSRVVNGGREVLPETAARVEEAVRALGYQRNDMARHLRHKAQSTATVGLVIDDLANPFYAALARAVEDEARNRDYLVLIGSSNDSPQRTREVMTAFGARRVDGLIVVAVAGTEVFMRQQRDRGVRVVCVDRPAEGLDLDAAVVDNRGGARQAVETLLDHGHRRIAFVGDRGDIWTAKERYAGYQEALVGRGLAVEPGLVRQGIRTLDDAERAVVELLAAPEPPTALFTANNVVTIGAVDGLGDRRSEVALIGFDDFPLADKLDPPVTVVSQDPVALGATAAQLLFGRIGGDRSRPRTAVLLTTLVTRGSEAVG